MLDCWRVVRKHLCPHIWCIRRTLDPETHRSGVVLCPATAERNTCSADDASSLERHYLDGFTDLSARALGTLLKNPLDKIHFVVEQGGLGYGG